MSINGGPRCGTVPMSSNRSSTRRTAPASSRSGTPTATSSGSFATPDPPALDQENSPGPCWAGGILVGQVFTCRSERVDLGEEELVRGAGPRVGDLAAGGVVDDRV